MFLIDKTILLIFILELNILRTSYFSLIVAIMSFTYFNVKEDLVPCQSAISMVERNVGDWAAVTADHSPWATAATCFIEDESKLSRRSKPCDLKPLNRSSFESVDLLSQGFPSPARDASTRQLSTCVYITEDAVVGRFA